ncbi:polysaccharide export protein [candidate division KSB1 bacterium]|nr:polysaccharide export protein [candidate division KSB1 bacterium]
MKKFLNTCTILAVILMVARTGRAQLTVYRENSTTDSTDVEKMLEKAPYRLGFGDVIEIKFLYNTDFNETVSVAPDGKIAARGVGYFNAAGKTVQQLDDTLTAAYNKILNEPNITIFVRQYGGQHCYVAGHVKQPGMYPVEKGMSVYRAVTAAGGPLNGAKLKSTILIRGDENKNIYAVRLDIRPRNLKKLLQNDRPVRAYDIVYVPRTVIADVDKFVDQFYNIILPPLDTWVRWERYGPRYRE